MKEGVCPLYRSPSIGYQWQPECLALMKVARKQAERLLASSNCWCILAYQQAQKEIREHYILLFLSNPALFVALPNFFFF